MSASNQHNSPPPYYNFQDDEITLKEVILKLQEFWSELWKTKLWIILAAVILGGLYLMRTVWLKHTTYTAGISFMVAEDGSSEQGRAISPFDPLDFRGVQNNQITELARSGKIIYGVVLEKTVLDNKYDYLANHIIDIYGLHEQWKKEPLNEEYQHLHLEDFYFSQDSVNTFSTKELRALSIVHELVSGNNLKGQSGIMSISYNDATDIFRLNVVARHEALSIRLVETIINNLKDFYSEEIIGRPKRAYEMLTVQVDSIFEVLSTSERQLALAKDRGRALVSTVSGLNVDKLQREVTMLNNDYQNYLRNKKNLELFLTRETPEFQIIDQTFFPIENRPSILRSLILGGFMGAIFSSIFFICRKIVRDAMAE